jgi:hypothetical protein
MNFTLNALDSIFFGLEKLTEFDYVNAGRKVINGVVTVAAVIVALCTYMWTALQLFWDEHGEGITVGVTRAVFNVMDFGGNCLLAGREMRFLADKVVAQAIDRAYYSVAFGI